MLLAAGPTLLPLLLLLLAGILVAELLGVKALLLSSTEPLDAVGPADPLCRLLVSALMADVYLPRWAELGAPLLRTVLTEVALLSELRELRKLLRDPERSTSLRELDATRFALSRLFL